MSTGQLAYLVMVVAAFALLQLSLAWAVLYTWLGDRRDRRGAALASKPQAQFHAFETRHAKRIDRSY